MIDIKNYPGHAWYRFNAGLIAVVGIALLVTGRTLIGVILVLVGVAFFVVSEVLLPSLIERRGGS